MKKCDCLLCKFNNPKPTSTAVIIKDQKLLVGKRSLKGEPFYGQWDFFGGFLQKGETPEDTLKREIKEELGVSCSLTFLKSFTGKSDYQGYGFPVITFAYLTEIMGDVVLDKKENSEIEWVPIKKIKTIAFDSNQKILKYIKEKLTYDLKDVRELVAQLDSSASINEDSLYKAVLNGYISKVEKNGKIIGMGWIFPRRTLLRKQAVVEDMIINDKYRGQGLGKRILIDLIDWAKKQKIEVVELTTNPKRIAANSLYKKVGFRLHETNHYLLELDS